MEILFRSAAMLGLALAILTQPTETHAPELTVDDVLARHVDAIGGAAAVDAVRNIRIWPQVVEPDFTIEGDYRATRDGRMRVDIYADGERVFSEGIDALGGWQQGGEGAAITEASETATAALDHGIAFNIFGLHDLAARGGEASFDGRATVDGIAYYVVRVVLADGFTRYFYINPESWLIERHRETSALHPDLDAEERPAETIESDFQRHCGVLRAMRTRKIDLETGEEIQRTQARAVVCNADPGTLAIGRSDFVSPPE
ncbi:hypothetical protein [Parasphingopyxis marina]|uniref:Lipoprotein n=1 Tax=Parasphingopyxis marina TaxID=2761622 RepID=A0A842HW29_9SPHN|nr:hypothetical protein [Parasphingopyxis marina]MBC2776150.1 hypothetical protein [Parasphingopyxis marina]